MSMSDTHSSPKPRNIRMKVETPPILPSKGGASVIAVFIVGTFNYQLSIVNYAAQEATPMAPASAVSTAMRILSNLLQSRDFIDF